MEVPPVTAKTLNAAMTELASLDASGRPPRTRIDSAMQVRDMYARARRHNALRSQRNSLVKGLVDGNPPYDQGAINRSGQRYRSNFNNGEAEAFLNVALTAFYDLFSEVETHATVEVDDYNNPDAHKWSECLTRNFEWLQRQDEDFDFNIQLSQHDMVLYGAGPHLFEDPLDWRSRPVRFEDMLLPRWSESNVTRWEWVIFFYQYTVSQLYEFISDEDAARMAGWDVAAVKRSIMLCSDQIGADPLGRNWQKWETWQQALRNNDLWLSDRVRMVRTIRMLYKEFAKDGAPSTVSEVWADENDTANDTFLFQKENAFENMKQACCPFFYDRGDGTAHSVRGLGVKMYKLLVAKMRLQNGMVDSAFARGSVMLKSLGGGVGAQQLSMTHLGPYTVMPAGFDYVANVAVPGVLDAFKVASLDMDNTLTANLSQYRSRVESAQAKQGNPRTAYEVNQDVQQQSALTKTQIARYYEQLDDWYSERFRRALSSEIPGSTTNKWLKLALDFQKRCKEDSVPLEKVRDKCHVRATRASGQGSSFVRIQALNMILNTVWPTLPEEGKQAVVRDLVAAAVGREHVNRYAGGYDNYMSPTEAENRWEAQQENNDFAQGGNSLVTGQQNDLWHLDEHFGFLNAAAGTLREGGDPMKVWTTLDTGGKHVVQHLQRMAQDPKRKQQVQFFMLQFKQLSAVTDELGKQIQQAQEQQAQAQQQAMMQDREMQTAVMKLQLQAQKDQANLALKREKQDETLRLKAENQQFNQAITDAKTAHEIQTGTVKTAVAVQTQRQKAAAKPTAK
jgi:hypothetical protein